MDLIGTKSILEVLFGNLGPLGTVFVMVAVYQAWLLKEERAAHKHTQEQLKDVGEKRLELHVKNVELLAELQHSLEALRIEIKRRRS